MAETWYSKAVRLPITTKEYYKQRSVPVVSEVKHITAGTDSRSWLQNANNGASVHLLIRVENGVAVVYQFMPIEWAAWGNGRFSRNNPFSPKWIRDYVNSQPNTDEGNKRVSQFLLSSTISVEHEGVTPTAALYTGPMLEASIELSKWLADTVPTIVRDREHIIGHYQIDHLQRPFCPGGTGGALFPFARIVQALNPIPAPSPTHRHFPETGYWVGGGFLIEYDKYGLGVMGYPISMEYTDGDFVRQDFENVRLRWKAGEPVRFDAVTRLLIECMEAL